MQLASEWSPNKQILRLPRCTSQCFWERDPNKISYTAALEAIFKALERLLTQT